MGEKKLRELAMDKRFFIIFVIVFSTSLMVIFSSKLVLASSGGGGKSQKAPKDISEKNTESTNTRINLFIKAVKKANTVRDINSAYNKAGLDDGEKHLLKTQWLDNATRNTIADLVRKRLKSLEASSEKRSKTTLAQKKKTFQQKHQKEIEATNLIVLQKVDRLKTALNNQRKILTSATGRTKNTQSGGNISILSVEPSILHPDQLLLVQGKHFFEEKGIAELYIESEKRFISMIIEEWSKTYVLVRLPDEIRPFIPGAASVKITNDNGDKAFASKIITAKPHMAIEVLKEQLSFQADYNTDKSLITLWENLELKNGWTVVDAVIDDIELFVSRINDKESRIEFSILRKADKGSKKPKTIVSAQVTNKEWEMTPPMGSCMVYMIIAGPEAFGYGR